LCDEDRPVQVIFAGKAHPRDDGGKALIRRIVELSHDERFHDRVVFVPGYGIDVARELVQGADVWLNNPRRPMEASGTSGMKAAANGVLNVSILDGWWDEAYRAAAKGVHIGWAIGEGENAETARGRRPRRRSRPVPRPRGEVVPLFYDRDPDGIPHAWARRAAASIREVAPFFSSHRMVRDYTKRYRQAAQPPTPSPPASPRRDPSPPARPARPPAEPACEARARLRGPRPSPPAEPARGPRPSPPARPPAEPACEAPGRAEPSRRLDGDRRVRPPTTQQQPGGP
jgi:hypothetical protein